MNLKKDIKSIVVNSFKVSPHNEFGMTVDGNNTYYQQYAFYNDEIAEFEKYLNNVVTGEFKSGGSWIKGDYNSEVLKNLI